MRKEEEKEKEADEKKIKHTGPMSNENQRPSRPPEAALGMAKRAA